ncbi:MAG: hypothetical protein VB064_08075 [Oscillospiraceae bacterium]|nr:hypothetical protein [Oscillospiraceae bacterium]
MNKRIIGLVSAVTLLATIVLSACSDGSAHGAMFSSPSPNSGQIYLYGEQHGVEKILDKEFELWSRYYNEENMRHLFVELPYYTAEYLNIWMQSDSDDILNKTYDDWDGSVAHSSCIKEFYKTIKSNCPETIFHGTDIGHQYETTGKRFLDYLEDNNMKDSEQYLLTQENIEQGKHFYVNSDFVYRENKMTENFIREFNKLGGDSVMGIYGGAHTGLDAMDSTNAVPCMANQLKTTYGDVIYSEDLTCYAKADAAPSRLDKINVDGKKYDAFYFGKEDMSWSRDYICRDFWRLENSYDDFIDKPKTGDVLPYSNYPMLVEEGQVFVIDYTKADGAVERKYYRSDGSVWEGMPSTVEFSMG